jgi:hypothetical protein
MKGFFRWMFIAFTWIIWITILSTSFVYSSTDTLQTPLKYSFIDSTDVKEIPLDLQVAIENEINPTAYNGNSDFIINITGAKNQGKWWFLSSYLQGREFSIQNSTDNIIIIAYKDDFNIWQVGLQDTIKFKNLLLKAPILLLDINAKGILAQATVNHMRPNAVEYKFPWVEGNQWTITRDIIWHGDNDGDNDNALDFGTSSSDKRVVAAADGVITRVCIGSISVDITIRDADGVSMGYIHFDKQGFDTNILGKSVKQGELLGNVKPGTWSDRMTNCNYSPRTAQQETYAHLHWILPIDRSIVVDGCIIQYPRNYLECNGEKKYTRSSFLSSNRLFQRREVLIDYNQDGIQDIFGINKVGTGAGNKTEVHILNGADQFQSFLLNRETALINTGTDGQWLFSLGDFNADGVLDLYGINKVGTGAGNKTEVHILNGADQFQSFLLNRETALINTGTDGQWLFSLGDFNADGVLDLYGINKVGTGAGNKTEVHILNGADQFQSFLLHRETFLGSTGKDGQWIFSLGHFNSDDVLDLYGVNKIGTNSGRNTEVYVLNGSDQFQSYLLTVATVLVETKQDCQWSFPQGQCGVRAAPARSYTLYMPLLKQ